MIEDGWALGSARYTGMSDGRLIKDANGHDISGSTIFYLAHTRLSRILPLIQLELSTLDPQGILFLFPGVPQQYTSHIPFPSSRPDQDLTPKRPRISSPRTFHSSTSLPFSPPSLASLPFPEFSPTSSNVMVAKPFTTPTDSASISSNTSPSSKLAPFDNRWIRPSKTAIETLSAYLPAMGSSIGSKKKGSGTLGAYVKSKSNPETLYFITSGHVALEVGELIHSPSLQDLSHLNHLKFIRSRNNNINNSLGFTEEEIDELIDDAQLGVVIKSIVENRLWPDTAPASSSSSSSFQNHIPTPISKTGETFTCAPITSLTASATHPALLLPRSRILDIAVIEVHSNKLVRNYLNVKEWELNGGARCVRVIPGNTVTLDGRTSRDRRGEISSFRHHNIKVPAKESTWELAVMSKVVPFSAGGDSGSIVIDEETGYPVGLLWGGLEFTNLSYFSNLEWALGEVGDFYLVP